MWFSLFDISISLHLKLCKSSLIRETQRHLGMLQHMIKTQVFNLVIRGVDLLVRVFKVGLDDKRRREAILAGRRMIRACISAFGECVGNVAVRRDDLLDEFRELGIHKVGNHPDRLGLAMCQCLFDIAGHVLLNHRLDISSTVMVRLENGLASKEATLLGRVPVEFDGVLHLALDDIVALE